MGFSFWHLLVVLIIVFVVFGAGRLPQVMGDIGKGIRSLRDGMREGDEKNPPASRQIGQDKDSV